MDYPEVVTRNLFEVEKITALDDKVIVEYISPLKEYQVDYKYSDLKSRIVRGRSGNPSWTNLGYSLIMALMISAFLMGIVYPEAISTPYFKIVPSALGIFALIAFSLRLVKQEKVWFDDKDGNTAFLIKLTRQNRDHGENTIAYILNKINEVSAKGKIK